MAADGRVLIGNWQLSGIQTLRLACRYTAICLTTSNDGDTRTQSGRL